MNKYELTDEKLKRERSILHRIISLKSFSNVRERDLGGWIESEYNLDQEGDCWVYEEAKVFDNALVHGGARVDYNALVYGDAEIYDTAMIYGHAEVYGKAKVFGNAMIFGFAKVDYEVDSRAIAIYKNDQMQKVKII